MLRLVVGALAALFMVGVALAAHTALQPGASSGVAVAPPAPQPELPSAEALDFAEFFAPGPELKPTAKLRALNGKRVRLVGFMAQMEQPPLGGFYLVPRPVRCDEAGGGTADLPLESVLVLSESYAGKEVPFLNGKLDVSGVFELGNHAGDDGRVSAFRLRLDRSESEAPKI